MKHFLLIASLMTAAGLASAQVAEKPATEPNIAGQFSTQTPSGVPNPTQRPDQSMPNARANVRAEAAANNKSQANTLSPVSGEFSTVTNNQRDATPRVSAMSRQEVRQGTLKTRPRFGDKPESAVPTNPGQGHGTPQ